MVRARSKKFIYLATLIILVLFPSLFYIIQFNQKYGGYNDTSPNMASSHDINLKDLPQIDYSALNKTWYEPNIEMLIVSPNISGFINALEPLKNWKNEKGVKTIIASNYSKYEGVDKAEKIRNLIKDYYERDNIRWVLLAGDAQEDLIPIRYVYNPDTVILEDRENVGNAYYKPTDFYYADLTGNWDQDNDGRYGEASQYNANGEDEISWIPEVYVGRFPADTVQELEIMVNKTINYEKDPLVGEWMNKMLLAGAVSDTIYVEPPDGEDEARLTEYIWKNYVLDEMNFTHLFNAVGFIPEASPAPNTNYSLTRTKFKAEINSGYSTVLFAGHGDPSSYAGSIGNTIYTSSDAQSISNIHMPSLIYGDACSTASFDFNDGNIGEILILQDKAGAIGYIGALRVSWYVTNDYNLDYLNRANAKLFWREFFENKKYQQGRALYDSKVAYTSSDYFKHIPFISDEIQRELQRKNILTYSLLGDPEVDIYTNTPVRVKNTLPDQVYEGQLVKFTVFNSREEYVPYARVYLNTSDGKSRTVYANNKGIVNFRLPLGAYEYYDVKISGHNLIPSEFNFTTLPDTENPTLTNYLIPGKYQTVSSNLKYTILTYDNKSGIECVMILMSQDNFQHFKLHKIGNNFTSNQDLFNVYLNKLDPGTYSYLFVIRDYANNTILVTNDNFKIYIDPPLINTFLVIGTFSLIAIVGFAIFLLINEFKKYSQKVSRILEL
jgi:hypothetical protein